MIVHEVVKPFPLANFYLASNLLKNIKVDQLLTHCYHVQTNQVGLQG